MSLREWKFFFFSWYFLNLSKRMAEEKLMRCSKGTFLMSNQRNIIRLSVRASESILHYGINRTLEQKLFIKPDEVFTSLYNLVNHYSYSGLDCALSQPYSEENDAVTQRRTRECVFLSERHRELLRFDSKLASTHISEVWKGEWNETGVVAIRVVKNAALCDIDFLEGTKLLERIPENLFLKVC